MKSTWFHNAKQYEFAKKVCMAGVYKGMRPYDMFSVFLEASYLALRQQAHMFRFGQQDDKVEQDYLRVIKRAPNPSDLADALGLLCQNLQESPEDFLGTVFQCLGMADKEFSGQCFTPYELCVVMSDMILGDVKPDPDHRLTLSPSNIS